MSFKPVSEARPTLREEMDRLQAERRGIEEEGSIERGDREPEPPMGRPLSKSTTVAFYTEVNARLRPDMTVLNLGAGRGVGFERSKSPYEVNLFTIQGKVREYVGADPDHSAIARNMHVDRRVPIERGKPLPFSDGEFDLILCDWVLEHVTEPAFFANEVARVLQPGGWFCARTPNRWGITAVGASLIPSKLHRRVLRRVAPHRREEDIYPTVYRMNTRTKIRQYFPSRYWVDHSFMMNGQGIYFRQSPMLTSLVYSYWSVTPDILKNLMLVFLQKRHQGC